MDNEGVAPGHERCSATMRALSQGIAGRRPAAGMHACSSAKEWARLFRKLLAMHGGLKAVPKIDVQQLAAVSVQHEVAGVPIPKSEQVAHLRRT